MYIPHCPKYIQSSCAKSIYSLYKVHPKSISYTTYPPHFHNFFQCVYASPNQVGGFSVRQCVYASPNRVGGFSVRDKRRALLALFMFSAVSVLLPLLCGFIFSVFSSAEPLLSMSEWSNESTNMLIFLNHWSVSGKYLSVFFPLNNNCMLVRIDYSKQVICPVACQFVSRTCIFD